MTLWKNLVVALVAAFALAACSSSNDNGDSTSGEPLPPPPTAAERQMTLIENAQEGLDTALSGLDAEDPTADQIDAVNKAMSLLDDALAGANDLSPNETADARDDLDDAMTAYMDAQETLRTGMATEMRVRIQMEAIADAQEDLSEALDGEEISDLAAANEAYGDLKSAIDAGDALTDAQKASAMSDLDMADVAIANAELAMYENEAMAEGATLEEMLAAYQGKLAAAQRLADATAASDSDRNMAHQVIGAATEKIAQLNKDIQDVMDAEADKMRLANNEKAMAVAEAVLAHTTDMRPDIAGAPPVNNGSMPSVVDISRTKDVKIALSQSTPIAAAHKYAPSPAPTIQGWSSAGFMRTDDSGKRPVSEIVVAYTDIEEARDLPWTQTGWGEANGLTVITDGVVTIPTNNPVKEIHFTGEILPGLVPPTNTTGTENKVTSTEPKLGTFYGVSGIFSCASATCTVIRSKDGTVTTTDNSITFTPTGPVPVGGRMAKYAKSDSDYTYFGYWMESQTEREGPMSHDIETFHGGMEGATTDLSGVRDTASYYGAAAGVYVKKDGADDSLVVTDGKFTAVAELTARFGGGAIATDDSFEVEGTISDFMDGTMDLGFADLKLGGKDAMGGATINQTNGSFTGGETDGGGTSGNWTGQFYGNTGTGTTDPFSETRPATVDDYPMNVSGEFNGHFVNGHVAGAFGAEYDD